MHFVMLCFCTGNGFNNNGEELIEIDNNSFTAESLDEQNIMDFQSQSCLSMSECRKYSN